MIRRIASHALVHALAQATRTNAKYQVMINNRLGITHATPAVLRMALMQAILAKAVVKALDEASISNIMRLIIGAISGTKLRRLVSREGFPRIRNNRMDTTGAFLSRPTQWSLLRRRDSNMNRSGQGLKSYELLLERFWELGSFSFTLLFDSSVLLGATSVRATTRPYYPKHDINIYFNQRDDDLGEPTVRSLPPSLFIYPAFNFIFIEWSSSRSSGISISI